MAIEISLSPEENSSEINNKKIEMKEKKMKTKPEKTRYYVTLKELLENPQKAWNNTDPRCFLCNKAFSGIELVTGLNLCSKTISDRSIKSVTDIDLVPFSEANRYALFHNGCLDIAEHLFCNLFFKEGNIIFYGNSQLFIEGVFVTEMSFRTDDDKTALLNCIKENPQNPCHK
jgi:hypothetical protein